MRQRIMIALALVLRPAVVVADEPTTALDVLVEAQILRIIADLRRNFDTALLLITHNLGIVAEACDRVAVMYAGRIVEQGPAYDVTTKPAHPYSRELLRSTISLSTTELHSIPGAPPNLVTPPPACRFHPRCPDAMKVCAEQWPPTITVGTARRSECWLHAKEDIPAGPGGTARARGAVRRGGSMSATLSKTKTLIEVRDLEVHFALHGTFRSRLTGRGGGSVKAVDGVSFDLQRGRGPRPGRRVRLGQDDARPGAARPRAPDRRQREAARRGARRAARAPAAARSAGTCRWSSRTRTRR